MNKLLAWLRRVSAIPKKDMPQWCWNVVKRKWWIFTIYLAQSHTKRMCRLYTRHSGYISPVFLFHIILFILRWLEVFRNPSVQNKVLVREKVMGSCCFHSRSKEKSLIFDDIIAVVRIEGAKNVWYEVHGIVCTTLVKEIMLKRFPRRWFPPLYFDFLCDLAQKTFHPKNL